jgi:hypothetical protein
MPEGSSYHWYGLAMQCCSRSSALYTGEQSRYIAQDPVLGRHDVGGGIDAVTMPFSGLWIDPSPHWRKLEQIFQFAIMH